MGEPGQGAVLDEGVLCGTHSISKVQRHAKALNLEVADYPLALVDMELAVLSRVGFGSPYIVGFERKCDSE